MRLPRFRESYLLFSIGTLKPIWESLFPDCFEYDICRPRLLHSLTYSVVLGVILGMLSIGFLANSLGRRKGSILTASIMSGGAIGLFLSTWISSPVWLYRAMSVLFFVFGLGVGGEYPLSASSATEKAMQEQLKDKIMVEENAGGIPNVHSVGIIQDARPRGRQVQLMFTMQGVGIWLNSLSLTFLLLLTGETGSGYHNPMVLMAIWRIIYLVGAVILTLVLVTRCRYLEESAVWAADKQRREDALSQRQAGLSPSSQVPNSSEMKYIPQYLASLSSVSSLSNPTVAMESFDESPIILGGSNDNDECLEGSGFSLLIRLYGMRLFGASFSWLLWDVAFYGNKLFQSSFLLALTGEETTLFHFALAATLNSTIALFGYFGAAFLVDNPGIGRLRLQSAGLFLTGLMFIVSGFSFHKLPSFWLVVLYLGSTLFGQLGPNATTFLIPAEIFPTEMRTLCHGICAASGKAGALFAAVFFNFVNAELDFFMLCGYSCFLAAVVTLWCIPESTGMDVSELDRKWRMTLEGKQSLYRGAANHPKFRSMYEIWQEKRKQKVFDTADDFHDLS
jgi:MFS family permease